MKNFLKNILCNIDDEIQKTLVSYTPMLYKKNNNNSKIKEGVASCLYISYLGQEFILTAAHIFQNYDINSLYIDIVDIPLADLKKGSIIYPKFDKNYKENDYCLLFVDSHIGNKLKKFFYSFPIHPDAKKGIILEENYFLLGYPATKNFSWVPIGKKMKTHYYCLHLPRENHPSYSNSIFDSQRNIVLKMKKRIKTTADIFANIPKMPPKLQGMSGCGIWAVSHYPLDMNAKSQMKVNGKIIDIPHEYLQMPSISLQGMLTNYDSKNQLILGFTIQNLIAAIEHITNFMDSQGINEIIDSHHYPDLFF